MLGAFNEIDQAQMDWLFNNQFLACACDPRLPGRSGQQREAHIVNLSSIFGHHRAARQTAYSAANSRCADFRKPAATSWRWRTPGAAVGGASRRRFHSIGATRAPASARHRQRPPAAIDRPFRCGARTTPTAAALRIIEGMRTTRPRILSATTRG